MLEFLDALLTAAPERAAGVVPRLTSLAAAAGVDVTRPAADLDAAKRRREVQSLARVKAADHEMALLEGRLMQQKRDRS